MTHNMHYYSDLHREKKKKRENVREHMIQVKLEHKVVVLPV